MTAEPAIARLRADYQARLRSTDPIEAELARIQLERLDNGRVTRKRAASRRPADAGGTERSPTDFIRPWRSQLQALMTAAGNPPMRWRGAHVYECNHSPNHTSKSGSPVLVDLVVGSYWCRSCGERGGSAEVISRWKGLPIKAARRLLDARYGSGAPKPEDLEVTDD
jgi:hypothetical protein